MISAADLQDCAALRTGVRPGNFNFVRLWPVDVLWQAS